MSTFAARLKELRGAESQASFSAALGIHRIQYAKYEAGKNSPSIEVLERICRVHSCSADWLLGLDRGTSAAPVVNGSCNAVATGPNAKASVVNCAAGEAALCKKCKYLKTIKKLQKAGLQLPDDV